MQLALSRVRLVAAVALAATTCIGLSSCSALTLDQNKDWKTSAQMRADDAGYQVPTLVEPDSTDIRLHVPLRDGTTLISWRSATGVVRDDCKPVAGLDGIVPKGTGVGWWPTTVPAEGQTCGWWRVFQEDGTFFAFQVHPKG